MKKVRSKLRPTEIGVIKTFSLSPDDEVGEIAVQCSGCTYYYNNLSELCEKWEDYDDTKDHWCITFYGKARRIGSYATREEIAECKQIGNYFETKEEAQEAVEKLKALKRLKDKGFRFEPVDRYEALCGNGFNIPITATMPPEAYTDAEVSKDLDVCFGGEE